MRVLSLFSGIGGIDLGLERAGMQVVGQCEVDPFCQAVLSKHWPEVRRWPDVRELRGEAVGDVDCIAGGFPCTNISVAGKGEGIDGPQSGLWREMSRLVRELRPRWVLVENVPALRTRGADRVLGDLEAAGYTCWPLVVGACDVGAPHRRKRVWIVAHCDGEGRGQQRLEDAAGQQGAPGDEPDRRGSTRDVGDAPLLGLALGPDLGRDRGEEQPAAVRAGGPHRWPARPGEPQHEWEPSRVLGELPHGLPSRLVRRRNKSALRALGNACVPQCVEAIGRAILAAELT